MEKRIKVEGIEFGIKASAGTVRSYRDTYGRDIIIDIAALEKEVLETKTLSTDSAKIAENIIYQLAKDYDNTLPEIDKWLESFSPYFVYLAIPEVISAWTANMRTLQKSKKG